MMNDRDKEREMANMEQICKAIKLLSVSVHTDGATQRGWVAISYDDVVFSIAGKVEMLDMSEELPFSFEYLAPTHGL